MKSIFISKNLEELELLPEFCKKQNIQLIAKSFLNFEAVDFQIDKLYDCVFFSSPRSVKFFLEKQNLDSYTLIACAGNKTKEVIEKLGFKVDFTPTNSGNVESSSKEFTIWLNGKSVLFPVSTISNLSYSKSLKATQFQAVEVYETKVIPSIIQETECYVFTSPSNVEGFLKMNHFPKNSTIISWGESTTEALSKFGITPYKTLINSSEEALLKVLIS